MKNRSFFKQTGESLIVALQLDVRAAASRLQVKRVLFVSIISTNFRMKSNLLVLFLL